MMKFTKILALLLAICLLFGCTGCDMFGMELFAPSETTLDSNASSAPDTLDTSATSQPDEIETSTTAEPDEPETSTTAPDEPGVETSSSTEEPGTTLPTPPEGNEPDDFSPINVIMINDNHGVLDEEDGGIDKIATGISYSASLGNIVKIANGDMFQGTYISSTLRGLPMLDVLNELDFDAFVIGNHEFDWGLDEIQKYKDGDLSNGEAEFPFLGANIYDTRTGERVEWIDPYTVVTFGEIKIGIIGIIGDVETSILVTHVENYDFVDPRNIVKDLAKELRTTEECDVVIVAIHGDDDSLNADIAKYTGNSKIDAIFTAHSHIPTDEEIRRASGNVCVLQNGGYGDSFAALTLTFDENGNLKDTDGVLIDGDRFADTGILNAVFGKYEEYMAIGETVLLTVPNDISKYDVGISVAQSMYVKYNVDFAVINKGGVRTSIDAGEVTYAEVFQVLPFENEVYIVTLSGKLLKSYLNSGTSIYYWGISKNSIVDNQYYQIAIIDYVYVGYTFDDYRNESCIDTNDLVRDVFIEFLQTNSN